MGDYRARVKIEFEMFEKKFETEFDWINYSPDDNGVDYRVARWFDDCWEEFQRMHDEATYQQERENEERREYELYQSLKAKYEGGDKRKEGNDG
jgi:hypothetical protein